MAANNPASASEKEQIFGLAEKEMEYRVDLFDKLTQTGFNKCIENKYKESELNMGENSCIDRCVSKYWQRFSRDKPFILIYRAKSKLSNMCPRLLCDSTPLLLTLSRAVPEALKCHEVTNLVGELLGSNRPPL